ncbi:hypothetical protein N0V82_002510 [Gnomoniopsis sp. IMI 355080]|nr:hypothetical protein N0V82_002510 [Gnomoniopsis sp. IMI 355080]
MSKPELEVLSQQIGDDDARYRIRAGNRVYYITIPETPTRLFDQDTLCEPPLLLPKLPELPSGDWTEMTLTAGPDGRIVSTVSYEPLEEITACWHPRRIDVLSVKRTARYNPRTSLVEFEGEEVVCKLAPFPWEMRYLQRETEAYKWIAESDSQDSPGASVDSHRKTTNQPIAPRFLGHLTENGRVIGFLMEKIKGTYANLSDLPQCAAALRTLHSMGLVHGDVNKHNFVVDREMGEVRLIDFESADLFSEEEAQRELEGLANVLTDTSNLGVLVEVVVAGPDPFTPYIFQG